MHTWQSWPTVEGRSGQSQLYQQELVYAQTCNQKSPSRCCSWWLPPRLHPNRVPSWYRRLQHWLHYSLVRLLPKLTTLLNNIARNLIGFAIIIIIEMQWKRVGIPTLKSQGCGFKSEPSHCIATSSSPLSVCEEGNGTQPPHSSHTNRLYMAKAHWTCIRSENSSASLLSLSLSS